PLSERRRRLGEVVMEDKGLRLIYWVADDGAAFYAAAKEHHLEGVIAKRAASRYLAGRRSDDWRKIKILKRQDCVVLGWTPGQKGRSDVFGALLVGAYKDEKLIWVGQVGSGFTDRMLIEVLERLKAMEADQPAIRDSELRKVKGARWARPELVCEVEDL